MKRPIILTSLMLIPASGWAQGLPLDFDPEPVAVEAVQAPPAASSPRDEIKRPLPVRYAERSVRMVNGSSPMAEDLDMSRLPNSGR
ncbi:MAG: hypothetical protein ABW128_14650 [Rhizorhabdus sp.]